VIRLVVFFSIDPNVTMPFAEGGPCVGWRSGPDEPFTWLTYQQVWTNDVRGHISIRAKLAL